MHIIPLLQKELEQEAAITRRFLKQVPIDKPDYKPHEKSMAMKDLVAHVAELPGWVAMALKTSELDFAKMDYQPTVYHSTEELLQIFEKALAESKTALEAAREEDLLPNWTMRTGDQVHAVMNKYDVIRHSLAQTIHHRAQLGVYFRLLGIPVPASYGPSADEQGF